MQHVRLKETNKMHSKCIYCNQKSTTSFLTAATLIYANRAGITAGAGTRLVLYLFLIKVFKLFSFQSQF